MLIFTEPEVDRLRISINVRCLFRCGLHDFHTPCRVVNWSSKCLKISTTPTSLLATSIYIILYPSCTPLQKPPSRIFGSRQVCQPQCLTDMRSYLTHRTVASCFTYSSHQDYLDTKYCTICIVTIHHFEKTIRVYRSATTNLTLPHMSLFKSILALAICTTTRINHGKKLPSSYLQSTSVF